MKIRITKHTAIKGLPVEPGKVLDVDESTARVLISYRKAEAYQVPIAQIEPDVVHREPAVEHRDPEIKSGAKPPKSAKSKPEAKAE
ncbi:MAG: hypothetical protein AB1705_14520 [Verrucomicrobiota bacterium]